MEPERLSAAVLTPNAPFRLYHSVLTETYPLHWHDFYELAIVTSGEGVHWINGRPQPLNPNTLFLLSPVDFHQLDPLPGQTMILENIIFGGEFLDDELRQWLFNGQDAYHFILPVGACERVRTAFESFRDEENGQSLGRERLMRSALERILLEVARHAPGTTPAQSFGHPAVHNALLYLHHHFRSPLTLENVAAQAGLAPTYFTHIFHQVTGMQFQKYLQTLRLRFAAALLQASTLPVTEICFASGFGDMAHFGRVFHARYGLSPSHFRSNPLTPPSY